MSRTRLQRKSPIKLNPNEIKFVIALRHDDYGDSMTDLRKHCRWRRRERLLNHAHCHDAFYLGVISAGCRSILSDRERSCRGSSCSRSRQKFNIRDNDGTADDDHRPPPRDGAPLRGHDLAAPRPGEFLRVAADLCELPANAAMCLVLHDGNMNIYKRRAVYFARDDTWWERERERARGMPLWEETRTCDYTLATRRVRPFADDVRVLHRRWFIRWVNSRDCTAWFARA